MGRLYRMAITHLAELAQVLDRARLYFPLGLATLAIR